MYWNSESELFGPQCESENIIEKFQAGVPAKGQLVYGYKYSEYILKFIII